MMDQLDRAPWWIIVVILVIAFAVADRIGQRWP